MADNEESYVEMWDNEELKEDESIVTQYEIVNNEEMNSTRAIPQRDNPSGRLSVFPLCYPVHWGNGYGYHYEMPTTMYFPINYGHTNKMPVNELVVTLCHLMSYHWKPSNYPWMYMPYTIDQIESNDKPNVVAAMFKTVSDELGVRYDLSRGCELTPTQCINGVIPFLRNNGYNSNIERFLYNDDENSFSKVYNNLRAYRPVLVARMYQKNSYIDQNKDYLNDSYVIDGYQEVQVKVTKKKYFLGICVSTKVSYYYSDYFRFLYPWGGSFYRGTKIVNGEKATGWFQQDHVKWDNSNISGYKKYTFINIY